MNILGRCYYKSKKNLYWKIYYRILGIPFFPYHYNYNLLLKHVNFLSSDRILDVGCGDGCYLNQISRATGCSGIGIDREESRINIANLISNSFKINTSFINRDVESFYVFNSVKKYTKVLCMDVLEHVKKPKSLIKYFNRYLEDGGKFILRIPYKNDKKILLDQDIFSYGADKHIHSGYDEIYIKSIFKSLNYSKVSFVKHYYFLGQLTYELLERTRLYNRIIHSMVYPLFLVIFYLDRHFKFKRAPNGLLVIATK